ncbi:hypothetical protein SDJN02_16028, partial [Cucurbita argyrosperma subsp. argyrosperma]
METYLEWDKEYYERIRIEIGSGDVSTGPGDISTLIGLGPAKSTLIVASDWCLFPVAAWEMRLKLLTFGAD